MNNIHATSLVFQGQGLLLTGASGSGKSDLALRLINGHGFTLIADDRTDLEKVNNKLQASAPPPIAGLLEVRGLGLVNFPYQALAPVRLVVELVADRKKVERLPEPQYREIEGIKVPLLRLYAFDASAPFKIILALQQFAVH